MMMPPPGPPPPAALMSPVGAGVPLGYPGPLAAFAPPGPMMPGSPSSPSSSVQMIGRDPNCYRSFSFFPHGIPGINNGRACELFFSEAGCHRFGCRFTHFEGGSLCSSFMKTGTCPKGQSTLT